MKYPIGLGRKMGGPLGMDVVKIESSGDKEMHYPSVNFDWEKDYDFPDEGIMTVRFRKTRDSKERRPDGKMNYSLGLDLLEIVDTEAAKESEEKTTGDILDDYLGEKK